jgi:mannosyl-3-phosphoglycerate phosphatase
MKKIVYSDLDGTLLDHRTYSFAPAKKALNLLRKHKVPLIVCTSKTRSEIEFWRKEIGNTDPFISENGGGIFIPIDYFDFDVPFDDEDSNYYIINLGIDYGKLIYLHSVLKKKYGIHSFFDMSIEEIAHDTGLPKPQAALAKKREYGLPFKINNESQEQEIKRFIEKQGHRITQGGRYYHLLGNNDKGKAVTILSRLYQKKHGAIHTIGIGDSENDFDMLNVVDSPYLVMKKDGSYASSEYKPAGGAGPNGWEKVIEREIKL